jgi:hypothetical protein
MRGGLGDLRAMDSIVIIRTGAPISPERGLRRVESSQRQETMYLPWHTDGTMKEFTRMDESGLVSEAKT